VTLQTDAIGLTTLILVLLPWLAVVFGLLFKKSPDKAHETKRAPGSLWGMALQSVSFALVWSLPRPRWWPFRESIVGEVALSVTAVVLTYVSAWLAVQSVRTLGKQWTYKARVMEGHELVTQGPYSLVRNPIYLGMFGAILGAGLLFARWWTLLAAMVLFLVGNRIRIHAEERLLRETFGAKYDEYASRVPAFFPRHF
jgi:protein-S-isoprenylcysteine O-methyltransferase Ste14